MRFFKSRWWGVVFILFSVSIASHINSHAQAPPDDWILLQMQDPAIDMNRILVLVNLRTGEQREISPSGNVDHHSVLWSPDGSRIIFGAGISQGYYDNREFPIGTLYSYDIETSTLSQLNTEVDYYTDLQAAAGGIVAQTWRTLAVGSAGSQYDYVSDFGGSLFTTANGDTQSLLTAPTGTSYEGVQWSDTNQQIVLQVITDAYISSANSDIAITDGLNEPRVLINSSEWESAPIWSPDGTKIAFIRDPNSRNGDDMELVLWDVATDTEQVLLTDIFTQRTLQWMPQTNLLLLATGANDLVDRQGELWAINPTTGTAFSLTFDTADAMNFPVAIAPDESYLAYVYLDVAGTMGIRVISVADGQVAAEVDGFAPAWHSSGDLLYVTRDDIPIDPYAELGDMDVVRYNLETGETVRVANFFVQDVSVGLSINPQP